MQVKKIIKSNKKVGVKISVMVDVQNSFATLSLPRQYRRNMCVCACVCVFVAVFVLYE